jgi:glucose/arabinose dehydrogenase
LPTAVIWLPDVQVVTTEYAPPAVTVMSVPVAEEKASVKALVAGSSAILMVWLAYMALVAIGSSVYFYMKLHEATADPSIKAKEDLQEVIEKVSRIMVLPDDEEPTLATVSDPEKLTDQPSSREKLDQKRSETG